MSVLSTMETLQTDDLETASILHSLRLRKQFALAMLSVLLYEYAVTCKDEYRHIWTKPFNAVLGVYLFSRYLALTAQVINTFLVVAGPLSQPVTSDRTCPIWFAFQEHQSRTLSGFPYPRKTAYNYNTRPYDGV
ncbi:hypothetical protein CPC08DRAFT_35854 [Agrocybe pediades]|nr:hypothetical protein CPC08DRAFT_35854 [Agrocybe pediades]